MNNTIFERITVSPEIKGNAGETIGYSRKGKPIQAFRLGNGPLPISLVSGLHADEPVGPRYLRRLTSFLKTLPESHLLLRQYQWWIIPHANPDGEWLNRAWTDRANGSYQLASYLSHVVSDSPLDDMEFGFPIDDSDKQARPENKAILRWWETSNIPFRLHLSIHGMTFGQGPWFMIDPAWISRSRPLIDVCTAMTVALGYQLQDGDYLNEKGVIRICQGFSTRPDSWALKSYYDNRDKPEIAASLRPSSMEVMRKLSGDCLTLMTEIPLFIIPAHTHTGNGQYFSRQNWYEQFDIWRRDGNQKRIETQADNMQVKPMPVEDQMMLIFEFMRAGIKLVE